MNRICAAAIAAASLLSTPLMTQAENPFYTPFATEHGTPPFSRINDSQWEAAIDRGIELAKADINAITMQRSRPDFDNTIVALENAGAELDRVLNVFYPLLSANSTDAMMEIAVGVSQKLSDYSTSVILNEELWKRVKEVYDNRALFDLSPEDQMLLQKTYDSFALAGADLKGEDREKYRTLSAELSALTTAFGQNVLRELNTYEIWLGADDLAGLPESSVEAAAEAAAAKGRKGEYLFTLDQPVYMAFMKYSSRPDLREKMYSLYTSRNTKGEYSNLDNIRRISELRLEIARLLGAKSYADHSLRRTMAKNPEAVYELLDKLRDAYRPALDAEMAELTEFASKLEGKPVQINPWDYSYYSNKLKAAKYSFDEEALRPYFELGNVVNGVFGLATKLYGLNFTPNEKVEVYHPDVKAYDVTDANGRFLGVLYTDFFPVIHAPGRLLARDDRLQGPVCRRKRQGFTSACIDSDELHQAHRRQALAADSLRSGNIPSRIRPRPPRTARRQQVQVTFGHLGIPRLRGTSFAIQRELPHRKRVSRRLRPPLPDRRGDTPGTR